LDRRKEEQALGFNAIKMPTFVGNNEINQTSEIEDSDLEEELAYETVENVELDDSNSFLTDEIMEEDSNDSDDPKAPFNNPKVMSESFDKISLDRDSMDSLS
jgi:hypothetical protein